MPINPSRKISKRAAVALGLGILVLSGVVVAAGATGTSNALLPMLQGKEAAYERSLSRDTVALAVHVGAAGADGEPQPLGGALVTISTTGDAAEPVAAKTTNDRGIVVFELRPGEYAIEVAKGDLVATHQGVLRQDTRVGVTFDEEGQAHWRLVARDRVVDEGPMRTLYVRVGEATEDGRAPLEDARVVVARLVRDDAGGHYEPVARQETGPRGLSVFHLHAGIYGVDVTHGDAVGQARVDLRSNDAGIGIFFDENGTAHVFRHQDGAHTRESDQAPSRDADGVQIGIRVLEGNRTDHAPVAGAHVVVYRIDHDDSGAQTQTAVARGATDRQGSLLVTVRPGAYRIVASDGDAEGERTLRAFEDTRVGILLQA